MVKKPSSPHLILFLFLLYPLLPYADIPLGSTLTPTNNTATWTSQNQTFSLSFIPISSSTFSAAISFSGIPVWKAGGDTDGVVDSAARFEFQNNGNLRLVNGSGAVKWESGTSNRGVSVATLDDSGNLSLKNGSLSIWSSFDNPTDTILPSQSFSTKQSLKSGSYSFGLLAGSGNLTLKWNQDTVYWTQGLNSSFAQNLASPSLGLQPNGVLVISDVLLVTNVVMAYSSDYGEGTDILRFVRLDSDGNLRIYSSGRGTGTSTERWAAVLDQCQVYGWCGNMGICSYNDTEPVCGCPSENFEFLDPKDSTKGCQRKMEIKDCPSNATMLQLEHTQFLTFEPERSSEVFFVGISACRGNCLVGESCVASTSLADGTGLCYLKVSSFVSGYQSPAIPSTSFVKVCGPLSPNAPKTSTVNVTKGKTFKMRAWVVAVVVLCTLVGLVLLEGGLWLWCCRNSPNFAGLSAQYALLEYASGAPVQFSYKELQHSTKGFKEKLGSGGFGAVYRGILANRTVVAVKQLEGIEQGEKQFRMEVATISSTHHLNLVRLIGFCSEGRHRLLVYEFMKNGSLDSFLFILDDSSGKMLSWETRFKVALGTARGITYLHEECRDCIIHCDIKPENILLDENYNAKVSDFGLAKLINPKDHHRTLTSLRGTRGYLAPEWLANLPITSKSDIYSYGMVLLEIISGRRNFDVSEETGHKKFSTWAYEEYEKGNVISIVDKRLAENDVDMQQVVRAIEVSFWCIQEQPSQRPSMGKVVQMLEGIAEIKKPPVPKATADGSISGTSVSVSVSALSTIAPSAPEKSITSSAAHVVRSLSSRSENNSKTFSSFLKSD
ncbi:hypothetical protein GIB67_019447 [Kingdonia uniflora]|uniref:Receptor-like serine/threonine-protein kinase n=1 Tax=Kingdonia uniflora TaxID=39325 RepID=A0A7J7MUP8_9MAGN|nr:hypothetical protein GIB67_019447 [Kingdonia uniflora]